MGGYRIVTNLILVKSFGWMLLYFEVTFPYTGKLSPVKDWILHVQWSQANRLTHVNVTVL